MPCVNHPDVMTDLLTCSRCGKDFCGDCIITLKGQAVCAGCKGEIVQDVKSGVSGDDLALAGRGARLGAIIIDNLIIGIPMIILMVIVMMSVVGNGGQTGPEAGGGLAMILIQYGFPVIAGTLYEGLMLSKFNGQTLGKKALGIRVVQIDGEAITSGQAYGRGLSRVLMGLTQILGLIDALMIFGKDKATLHDRMAKTRVVKA